MDGLLPTPQALPLQRLPASRRVTEPSPSVLQIPTGSLPLACRAVKLEESPLLLMSARATCPASILCLKAAPRVTSPSALLSRVTYFSMIAFLQLRPQVSMRALILACSLSREPLVPPGGAS